MGILDIFKKKEPEVIEGAVNFVTDENGNKYLHINQFKEFLEDYKMGADPSQHGILNQIIGVLNDANNE